MSARSRALLAAVAALLATAGDLLLLYVANSQRSELGLAPIGRAWLWIGGFIGVVAIPFYALGYDSASRIVAAASRRAAQAVFMAGATGSMLGAVIHALTAAQIGVLLDTPSPGSAPPESLLGSGPILLSLWGLAALLVGIASVYFLWFVGRGSTPAPRCAAVANPAFVTLVLVAVGLPSDLLRAFLAPAAPNLAHLVFFLVCSRVAGSAGSSQGRGHRHV